MSLFQNMFGREQLGQLIEENLQKSRIRLFQVCMEKESVLAEEGKLQTRIARLEALLRHKEAQ